MNPLVSERRICYETVPGTHSYPRCGYWAVWEFASNTFLPPYLLSSPSKILTTFWQWLVDGKLLYHASITAVEAPLGFVLGALAGMICGIVLGRAKKLAELLNPFIVAFYSIPKVALAPLFIIWFGIG